jgi:hypothetical protein
MDVRHPVMKAAGLLIGSATMLAVAAPAHADVSFFLRELRKEYWTQSFTDQQLLDEAYKVCGMTANTDDTALNTMVASDLGISRHAAVSLVYGAEMGLGC